ncbi:MAG TPA: DNA helicase RecQ [Smithella sp.]|nr:DNA helicase RecQ [Smithella sp.]
MKKEIENIMEMFDDMATIGPPAGQEKGFMGANIDDRNSKYFKVLKTTFGYDAFWPLQEKIIAHILEKKDALVVMPTGGGKSLCYQIPSIIFDGLTIVVTPLISLMKDQVDQLTEYGVPSLFLNSFLDADSYRRNIEKIRSNRVKLLYLSPEALLSQRTLAMLSDLSVDCIAIDEAHCISEWGHDFRPEYRQLADVRSVFPDACCVALTATATPRVREDIRRSLSIDSQNEYIGSFNRPNLFLEVAPKTDGMKQVLALIDQYPNESGIIYCATRQQTEKLNAALQQKGHSVRPYHAGMSEMERTENQECFRRDDIRIIVATIAFGMGINKPNVRFVIHYDLPKSIDNYYQEIGRAGRDGLAAHCLLLFSSADIHKIQFFIRQKSDQEHRVANILLDQLIGFAETDICRRIPLLNYFGETGHPNRCDMCDNCRAEKSDNNLVDLTKPAQMFLSCAKRTEEIFGAGHIIHILRGSKSEKITKFAHDKLSTYGIGLLYSAKQWRYISRQLIQKGLLKNDYDHGSLKLTPKAWKVLRGEETFFGKRAETEKAEGKVQVTRNGEVETYDTELYEILRARRKELADQANLPPYVIFHDRTLREMSFHYPQTQNTLMEIHGVGKRKADHYGDDFLDVIRKYCQNKQIAEKRKLSPPNQPSVGAPANNAEPRHITVGGLPNEKDFKTFVILAASRKYGGYCIAGKEWADGKIGPWVRPVSRRTNGELAPDDIRMNNNELPCLMDIVEVETQGEARHAYQKENFFGAEKRPWIWQWKLPDAALTKLLDSPDSLWQDGFSSTNGLNDRVPEIVVENAIPSLYLIRPENLTILVTDDLYGRKKVNARFTYREVSYLLSVTDMVIEREYLMKPQGEYPQNSKKIYLTISLGEPFNGFCYKLVAAVMIHNED